VGEGGILHQLTASPSGFSKACGRSRQRPPASCEAALTQRAGRFNTGVYVASQVPVPPTDRRESSLSATLSVPCLRRYTHLFAATAAAAAAAADGCREKQSSSTAKSDSHLRLPLPGAARVGPCGQPSQSVQVLFGHIYRVIPYGLLLLLLLPPAQGADPISTERRAMMPRGTRLPVPPRPNRFRLRIVRTRRTSLASSSGVGQCLGRPKVGGFRSLCGSG
jgi:hypothetical protein